MVKREKKQRVIGLLLIVMMVSEHDMSAMMPGPLHYEATLMQNMSLVDQASLVVHAPLVDHAFLAQQPLALEQRAAQDDRMLRDADVAMKKHSLKKSPRVVNEAYLLEALERQAERDEDSFFFSCRGLGELPSGDDLEPSSWWQVYFLIEPVLRDYIPGCLAYMDKEAFQWQINRLLLYGADFNNKELVAVAICAGADKHIRNKEGQSAFDIARKGGHVEIVDVLEIVKQLPPEVRFTLKDDNLEDDSSGSECDYGDNTRFYCADQDRDGYCTMPDFESAVQEDRC